MRSGATRSMGMRPRALRWRASVLASVWAVVLAGCDTGMPVHTPGLVVEGIVETGDATPLVILRQTHPSASPGPDAADGARATLAVDNIPVALVGLGDGRYRALLPAPLAPGQRLAFAAQWDGAPAVSAATRVVPTMRLDSVRVTRPAMPVRAALLDVFGFDPALVADVAAREGFVYPVTVTAYWAAPAAGLDEATGADAPWVRIRLDPSATAAVRFFFPPEVVVLESRTTQTAAGRQARVTYAVEAGGAAAPLAAHRLRVAVVRGGEAYARFVETRGAPDRREPVSNVVGGRGLFAAVSTDSVRVDVR